MTPETSNRVPGTALLASILLAGASAVLLAGALSPRLYFVQEYRELAERSGSEFAIDPDFVLAVVAVESGGDPRARSPAGARGLMQLVPATAEEMAGRLKLERFETSQLDVADINIRLGTCYLRWLADRFGLDRPATVLAAYNAGYGTVRRWLSEIDGELREAPPDAALVARIEYPETRAYVRDVLQAWSALRARRSSD